MITDIFSMKSPAALLVLSVGFFAGCAATDNMRPIPIAGGKLVGIPFDSHGPMNGKANGYEIRGANAVPGATATQVVYRFALTAPPGVTLKRVVVDDISDEQSYPALLDDDKPWLDGNVWKGETPPFDNKDPHLKWVYTVTPSTRVYRFTITDSAGVTTILYQVTGYPQFMKAAMRFSWGEKY
jgi:hypothetical protein